MSWQQMHDLCRRAERLNFSAFLQCMSEGELFSFHNALTARVVSKGGSI